MQDYSAFQVKCEWTVKELVHPDNQDVRSREDEWRLHRKVGGIWIPRKRVKNLFTNYGLSALAAALSGGYTPPLYLALEGNYTTPTTSTASGSSTIVLTSKVDQVGDTQLILGVGQASQETVTFISATGTAPCTYTLSGTTANTHPTTDQCYRAPLATDTISNVLLEMQYDSDNFPNQRMQSPGGYSPGTGQWTVQFYFPGPTAQGFITLAGLTDSVTIGQGNLHNHFALGYNNNGTTNDLEIDGALTLINA